MKTVRMRTMVILLVVVVIAAVILTATFTYLSTVNYVKASIPGLDAKVAEIKQLVMKQYYKPVDESKLDTGMLKGLVWGLDDPYSIYMTAEETKDFFDTEKGQYEGIGIQVNQDTDTLEIKIVDVFKDGPAQKAGILPGDIIIAVEGTDVTGMEVDKVVSLIKGEKGTSVKVTVWRGQEKMTFDVIRDVVNVERVAWRMLEGGIGYLNIKEFGTDASKQFETAVAGLQADGVKGIILDLRNNPGGLVDQTSIIADALLPQGLIFYTLDRQGVRNDENAKAGALGLPMAVLVNEYSASASEILAGALQDNGYPLIGTKTFGKGIIQSFFTLKEGDTLKLTIMEYFTPKGREIQKIGLTPDYVIELPKDLKGRPDLLTDSNDVQLQKAVEVLRNNMQ
jgi:carboxyl-terminal processing protease